MHILGGSVANTYSGLAFTISMARAFDWVLSKTASLQCHWPRSKVFVYVDTTLR